MIFKKFYNHNMENVGFFAQKHNLDRKIIEVILSKGINTEKDFDEFLNPSICHDPFLLKGMKELKDRIYLAKQLKDNVLIFGDYDVDGVSASAIMLKTLKILGINADFYLPNRYVDGYGLTVEVIDKVIEKFDPQLIITVDCGISCYQEVEYAKTKGVEIVVTDHHEIPDVLPDTLVLNAKIEKQDYPFTQLCGTGLAYKISQALIGKEAEQFLPIAAIATIADIVKLQDENRTIVKKGLELFDKYLPEGIKALIKDCKLNIKTINSTEISFKVAPRLNASGRMGDAQDSLMLYLLEDKAEIKKYIEKIKKHNTKRQDLCNKIFEDCEKALKKVDLKNLRVITLASKNWDQGVLGIICSRIVEKYHRPTFLFSLKGDALHGSGRSINDINIHEILSSMQDILETYGGHSMAAGLTLKRSNYEDFSKRANAFVIENIAEEVFVPITYYDIEIEESELNEKFLKDMLKLEPFGCGNSRPKLKISAKNISVEPMKRHKEHANIRIGDLQLVFFNFTKDFSKIYFSREKSFIFELQGSEKKGVVNAFDGGVFVKKDCNDFLEPVSLSQMVYEKKGDVSYNLYSPRELLNLVASTEKSTFGTAFVTFSAYDYVNFSKNYSVKNLFHFGISEKQCLGYNSLLLSPQGVRWAKNFSKIVFLTPILNEGYVYEIQNQTNAQIYLPLNKKINQDRFSALDLSREKFGKIFEILKKQQNIFFNNIFEIFEESKLPSKEFKNFYSAFLTFQELKFIDVKNQDMLSFSVNQKAKNELTNSSFYNKIRLLKDVSRREND